MDISHSRTVKAVAILLLLAAISQPVYTVLYLAAPDVNRQFLWGWRGFYLCFLRHLQGLHWSVRDAIHSASPQSRFAQS